jgi:hypothetical protein
VIIYATPRALEEARQVLGEGVVVENLVRDAIYAAGVRRRLPGLPALTGPLRRYVLLDGAVVVIARRPSRLASRKAWEVVQVQKTQLRPRVLSQTMGGAS